MKHFFFMNPSTRSLRRVFCYTLNCLLLGVSISFAQQSQFVRRDGSRFMLGEYPFYFLGTNAYYLLEQSGRGDTTTVKNVYATAKSLGMNVVRTWGFYDKPDSTLPSVIQHRPGGFNERGLRALDYVIHQASMNGIRLLIPLVNNWNDYGGMNQYVRWRSLITVGDEGVDQFRYTDDDLMKIVRGSRNQQYEYAISKSWGHDDFYTDTTIRGWFKIYISVMLNRLNTYSGIRYKDDPAIFGWELANEPRSSDPTTRIVGEWIAEMAAYMKSIDNNHVIGTGEEGFDNTFAFYHFGSYNQQAWLFDGSQGISFSINTANINIDFGSIHLYPESWNLPNSSGNVWIRDHLSVASSSNKPLIIGEFGVREQKVPTYDSWLNTALLDGVAGAMVWQLLEGSRGDVEGFGFRCFDDYALCVLLQNVAGDFQRKSQSAYFPPPEGFALLQNYPNPFNSQTTISYSLATPSYVTIELFTATGEKAAVIVDAVQQAGLRKELFDGRSFPSGVYFYRLTTNSIVPVRGRSYVDVRKLVLLK